MRMEFSEAMRKSEPGEFTREDFPRIAARIASDLGDLVHLSGWWSHGY